MKNYIEELYKIYPHTIYCQQKIEELKVKFNMGAKCLCSPEIQTQRNKVLDLIQSAKKEAVEEILNSEEFDLEIQKILEPYFIVLDGRDNTAGEWKCIELSGQIREKAKELLK